VKRNTLKKMTCYKVQVVDGFQKLLAVRIISNFSLFVHSLCLFDKSKILKTSRYNFALTGFSHCLDTYFHLYTIAPLTDNFCPDAAFSNLSMTESQIPKHRG
jgi:hypothetical protein